MVFHNVSHQYPWTLGFLLVVLIASSGARPVLASSFCVVCDQPQATYECMLPKDIDIRAHELARRGLRLACLQGLAKARNHGQCSIRKNARGPCIGDRVMLDELVADAAQRARAVPAQRPGAGPPLADGQGAVSRQEPVRDQGEPRTLVELTERTIDATGKQIEKAGQTIEDAGGAATTFMQRSWTCVASLFADC